MDLKNRVEQLIRDAENEMDKALFEREDIESFNRLEARRDAFREIMADRPLVAHS